MVFYVALSVSLHTCRGQTSDREPRAEPGDATLENQAIRVWVAENGSISFLDKANAVRWETTIPGWVELSHRGSTETIPLTSSKVQSTVTAHQIQAVFSGLRGRRLRDTDFLMRVRLVLEDSHMDLTIEQVTSAYSLSSVEYPAHILNVKSGVERGYIVVPNLQGMIIPSRYDAGFMRYAQNVWDNIADVQQVWSFESGMLNMPWFGATRGASSVLAHVRTPADCRLRVIGNSVVGPEGTVVNARQGQEPGVRQSSLTPIWLASKQVWAYPRTFRLELVSHGYVGMAKRFRQTARDSGRYVTLKEKIARNPEGAKIIGAPDIKIYVYTNRKDEPYWRAWSEPVLNGYCKVHTTFDQVAEISKGLKHAGVEKAMILLGGWNRAGYDREHVDMWPPAEKAGGIEGLRRAAESVRESGYLFALHDNYDDFYPDAPSYHEKYMARKADGSILLGGVWDGGLCHKPCSTQKRRFLNRNLDLIQGRIPLNGYYFDVISSASLFECFDDRHPMTRREDLHHRRRLLNDVTARGLVIGGERGTDWALPSVVFCEGLSGGGTGYHRGITYRFGLDVPLFYLVYHECVVGYWQHGTPFGREDHANHVLHDLLTTQPSSWSIVYDQWPDLKPLIVDCYGLLGRLHERLAHEEMVDHTVLTDDFMVQRSEFGDGTVVHVNFGITSWNGDEFRLPPKGFRITTDDGRVTAGTVGRTIEYTAR